MSQVDEFGRAIPGSGGGGGSSTGGGSDRGAEYREHYGRGGSSDSYHRNEHRPLSASRSRHNNSGDGYHSSSSSHHHHHHHHSTSGGSYHSSHHNRHAVPPLSDHPPPYHHHHRDQYSPPAANHASSSSWGPASDGGRSGPRQSHYRSSGGSGPTAALVPSTGPPPPSSSLSQSQGLRGPSASKSIDAAPAVAVEEDLPSPSASMAPPHPSLRYFPDPMLCEFLWNEQEQKSNKNSKNTKEMQQIDDDGDANLKKDRDESTDIKKDEDDAAVTKNSTSNENPIQKENGTNAENDDGDDNDNDNDNDAVNSNKTTYDDYRLNYAWTFLKHFFNQHLDDSWFRQSYSPALMVEAAKLERRRCHAEATLLRRQLLNDASGSGLNLATLTKNISLTVPTNHNNNTASSSSSSSSSSSNMIPSSHLFGAHDRILHVRNVPPYVTDEHIRQALLPYLTEHVVAMQQKKDQQKTSSGKSSKSRSSDKKHQPSHQDVMEQTIFGIFASTPNNTNTVSQPPIIFGGSNSNSANRTFSSSTAPRGGSVFLYRSVFVVCTTSEVFEGLWQVLSQRDANNPSSNTNTEGNNGTNTEPLPRRSGGGGGDVHVPRKQDDATKNASVAGGQAASSSSSSTMLDLEIDCTDPYGRTEYDNDGRGGSPPDGLAIPHRKAVVSMTRYEHCGGSLRLSAAVSSPIRFVNDKKAATTIARALDVRQHVPIDDRLDSILEEFNNKLTNNATAAENDNNTNNNQSHKSSLLLDIALAYLRRVHMYSVYKGVKATSFGDMLAGRTPASLVQLREEVGMPESHEAAELLKDDLLGKRLDDSIRQALEVDCHAWIGAADWLVDEETDTAAREIAESENQATEEWLAKHVMDDDGRARCSFHFCHKLFKDESFLSKHLLKKHAAYNAAERAKCHDKYMMSVWESANTLRPAVPMILVDCGKQFGKHEAAISSGAEPRAQDPEPALWERKQFQDKLMQEKRQEMRAAKQYNSNGNINNSNVTAGGVGVIANNMAKPVFAQLSGPRPAFVDVDDMKDETLKVNFDEVKLPPVTKKKKKKRKLL
ncbi:hypothetical protein ACA910_000270 [Epithemia clementina (nom. ined.)]